MNTPACRIEPYIEATLYLQKRLFLGLLALVFAGGCAGLVGSGPNVTILVPGVQGDGVWYDGLKHGLIDERDETRVETFSWGAPLPMFALNFNSQSIHDGAERKLAVRIRELRASEPDAQIDIVAHSAGCGVTLGALALLKGLTRVDEVVLLAPSVSPTYELTDALRGVRGRITVFYSDRDTLFLSWRTSTFGTYDNIKTKAAGNEGFDLSNLSPEPAARVVQRAYDPTWKTLGNDGGHSGWLARPFVQDQIAPVLKRQ